MKRISASPVSNSQCRHRTPGGRYCRQTAVDPQTGLCAKHAAPHFALRPNANFLKRLTTDSDDFTTALGIHNSLSELYKLLAADLISARRAAVLAYIANLLLRTIPIVHSELDPDSAEQSVKIDIDLPRPHRENPKHIAAEDRKELSTSAASNRPDRKQ